MKRWMMVLLAMAFMLGMTQDLQAQDKGKAKGKKEKPMSHVDLLRKVAKMARVTVGRRTISEIRDEMESKGLAPLGGWDITSNPPAIASVKDFVVVMLQFKEVYNVYPKSTYVVPTDPIELAKAANESLGLNVIAERINDEADAEAGSGGVSLDDPQDAQASSGSLKLDDPLLEKRMIESISIPLVREWATEIGLDIPGTVPADDGDTDGDGEDDEEDKDSEKQPVTPNT